MSEVRLIHGDCLEVMRSLPDGSVDCILTDPPYGVLLGTKKRNQKTLKSIPYESFTDTPQYLACIIEKAFPEFQRLAKRIVLTPGVRNMWLWPKPDHVGAIYYPAASGCNSWGFSCWQPIFYYGKDPYAGKGSKADSFQSVEQAEKNGHPCPKPIKQWNRLLTRCTQEGETVLDPFMGSGTTGVSCVRFLRNFIGVEIEERYFCIAQKRIHDAKSQGNLFAQADDEP